jgi:molybdopterin converting factor small subunit
MIAMKILFRIEGIPALYKLMKKKKKLDFIFQGNTLQDMVDGLIRKFGPKVKNILLDKKDEIDIEYRVVINMSKYLSYGERMNEKLNEGDTVHLMITG